MIVVIEVSIVAAQDAAAVVAADIVLVKAALAERVMIVLNGAFLIDAIAAVITDYGQTVGAILAESIAFHLIHILNRVLCTAVCTNSCFAHWLFLHFVW